MDQNLSQSLNISIVRRTDVHFRAKFPHLETRIFEIEVNHFLIVFESDQLVAGSIEEEFQQTIRPIAHWIDISNEIPEHFLKEVPSIKDDEVADRFEGFSYSFTDIRDILLSKYPDLPEPRHIREENNPITLVFSEQLSSKQIQNVYTFMAGHLPGWPFKIEIAETDKPYSVPRRQSDSNIDVKPSRLRPHAPKFVRNDERFWYENLETIFAGRLLPTSIQPIDQAGAACYIDGSIFPAMDLRQALLLYDTIYLSPPIEENQTFGSKFWAQQSVTKDDVLKLIELGRVRLLLVQPEERNDIRFLEAAYERNTTGIIGRLTGAAVMAADITQTALDYRLAAPDLRPALLGLIPQVAEDTHTPRDMVSRLLLWPLQARRSCMESLRTRGLMGIGGFGLGQTLGEEIKSITGKDVLLESLVIGTGVHIAHAFRSTLIPPIKEMEGWIEPRRIVGDRLNFYRNFTSRITASWAVNERRKEARQILIPPLPLFEFDKYTKIDDIINLTSRGSTTRKTRALFTRLSDLSPTEREIEINELTRELFEMNARRGRRSAAIDNVNNVVDVGNELLDLSQFPFRSTWQILNLIINIARRNRNFDSFVDAIQSDLSEQLGRNSDLDILSKISRVAHIRDDP